MGGQGHPAGLDRAGVHVPQAARPASSCSTASTPGWPAPAPTPPPSATSARAGPTSPAPSPPRPRTPRADEREAGVSPVPVKLAASCHVGSCRKREFPAGTPTARSAWRVSGARAWSASIWIPRRSPSTRSPSANDDCIWIAVSSTSLSVRLRRTTAPVTISSTRAAGSTRIRMLRDGATSELCSWVANARGWPSTRPTNTLNSKREICSALRIASSTWNRSPALNSPTGTCATRLGIVAVRRRQLRGALDRATEPLVGGRLATDREPLARSSAGPMTARVMSTNSSTGIPTKISTACTGSTSYGGSPVQFSGTSALAGPAVRATRAPARRTTDNGGRGERASWSRGKRIVPGVPGTCPVR